MGIKIEINGEQMKVNGQEVDMTDPDIAEKYGISGKIKSNRKQDEQALREELKRAKKEREDSLLKAKKEREKFGTKEEKSSTKEIPNRTADSNATIFGLAGEQIANNEPLNLGPNVHIRMENVQINDTYIPSYEYGGNKSSSGKQQDTEEEQEDFDLLSLLDDDDFKIGTETYEQAYRETIPQQKGILTKLKELIHSMLKNERDDNER